jgi:hypothetical protein
MSRAASVLRGIGMAIAIVLLIAIAQRQDNIDTARAEGYRQGQTDLAWQTAQVLPSVIEDACNERINQAPLGWPVGRGNQ